MATTLSQAFLATSGPAWRARWEPTTEKGGTDDPLGDRLARAFADACARWPGVELDAETFAAWVGARVSADSCELASLAALCTDDLYLACACDRGDAVAVAQLYGECFVDVDAALRSHGLAASDIEDVRQQVIDEIVVPRPGRAGGLARYRGVGPLRRWLRTIAVRTAGRSGRAATGAREGDDALIEIVSDGEPDPELELARTRHREALAAAFAEAMAALSVRERNLLRQYFLDGLGVDALGLMYGVHRSTAARWVAAARRALADGTVERLGARIGGRPSELHSLVRLVHSHVDLSVRRLLGGGDDPQP